MKRKQPPAASETPAALTTKRVSIPEPVRVPIEQLHFADYNPRSITAAEMAKLKKSLREFGLVTTVVARRDGLVIGGHQRLQALREIAKEEGWTDVCVYAVFVDVDDAQAKLLNVALNKISGNWDYAKLSDLFGHLQDLSPEMQELAGFDRDEIADVLALGTMESIDIHAGVDPDEALAKQALKFEVVFATAEDSQFARTALRTFGMRGPGDAGSVLVAALRLALKAKGEADASTDGVHDRGDEGRGPGLVAAGGEHGASGRKGRRRRGVRGGDGRPLGGDGSGGAGSA